MAAVHVRVCVECNEEYRPEIARCADCGGVLQDRYDDESPGEAAPSAGPDAYSHPPEDEGFAIAMSEQARQLVPCADRLVEAGVEFRIASREVAGEDRPRGFELRVADADRSAAIRAVAPLAGPETGVTLLVAWTPPASEEADAELRCPACDTAVGTRASECPECGLGLLGER